MTAIYEWDEAKRKSNIARHGVDFTVMEAFGWDTAIINPDDRNSEPRNTMAKNTNDNDVTKMTFDEIAAKDGEEAAINAGIAADPDTFELDEEWFKRARPAGEIAPHIVEAYRRTRGKQKAPTKEQITIRLDADITAHLRKQGPGWQTHLNDTLRQAIFGSTDTK